MDLADIQQIFFHELKTMRNIFGFGIDMVLSSDVQFQMCALQFHISGGPEAQRTPLPVKLVLPDHAALVQRLELIASHLEGTEFAFEQMEGSVMVTDPFGQQFEVLAPSDDDTIARGIKEIMLPCAVGTAAAIGAFYEKFYMVIVCISTQLPRHFYPALYAAVCKHGCACKMGMSCAEAHTQHQAVMLHGNAGKGGV